jgi:hypothetical protein
VRELQELSAHRAATLAEERKKYRFESICCGYFEQALKARQACHPHMSDR